MEKNIKSDPAYCELKALYDSEMCKLKELEVEYDKLSATSVVFSNDQNPEEVLKHRVMFRLMAELSVLDSSPSESIPMDKKLLLLTAQQEILSEIEDLKSLESSLQEEKETLLRTQSKVRSDLEDEQQHLNAVKQKCITQGVDALNVNGTDEADSETKMVDVKDFVGVDDNLLNLRKRVKALKSLSNHRTNQLYNFGDAHFPAPSEEQVKSVTSKDIFAQFNDDPMKSLNNIINKLWASYFKNPQQLWVKLDSTYWIPHVEFLVRSGIAVRNPEDPWSLKLLV